MDVLSEPVYIAGVINPMFKNTKFHSLFDVIVQLDKPSTEQEKKNKSKGLSVIPNNNKEKGQQYYDYKSMKYHDLDAEFINSIAARYKLIGDIDDQDLLEAFSSYT